MAQLLLLAPSTSYRVADFLRAAKGEGIDIVVASDRRPALRASAEPLLDLAHPHRSVDAVVRYADARALAAIVGVEEQTAFIAAAASERLGLPHDSPDAIARVHDKYAARVQLARAGIPSPRFHLCPPQADITSAAGDALYPCVLKPVRGCASQGVSRADDPCEFAAALRRIQSLRPGEGALVEGFIAGREVAVEGLLDEGGLRVLAIFEKPDPLDGPFFEETLYLTPARLAVETRREIESVLEAALEALELRRGPVHAELRLNEDGAWIIEIAARSIGGLCSRALSFGSGIALEALILRQALGRPVGHLEREAGAAGVMMIPTPRSGVLVGVEGLAAARRTEAVEDVAITMHPGDRIRPVPEGDRYLGFIFARAASVERVERALRAAHAALGFNVE